MKTVLGSVLSSKHISLSKASSIMKEFMSSDNGDAHALRIYVKRTQWVSSVLYYLTSGKSERKKKKKSNVEIVDNGVLTDIEKQYEEEEMKSVGNTAEGLVKTERKKRNNVEEEMDEEEQERHDSRSNKKRKH